MPEPKGKLVTPVGITDSDDIKALLVDNDGKLHVVIYGDDNGIYRPIKVDSEGRIVLAP